MENRTRRGFTMSISEEVFSNIICEAMGLERGTFTAFSAQTHGWNRAIEVCAVANSEEDERFPIVVDGQRFPYLHPILKSVPVETEEGTTYKTIFDGFKEE